MFLAGHIVAMVTCYIKMMTATCLPMIGNFYDTTLVASLDNYELETVVSVLFSNTRTRLLYNEREIFNTARSEVQY